MKKHPNVFLILLTVLFTLSLNVLGAGSSVKAPRKHQKDTNQIQGLLSTNMLTGIRIPGVTQDWSSLINAKKTVYYFPAKRYQVTYSRRPYRWAYVLFLGTIKSTSCTYRDYKTTYDTTRRMNNQFSLHVEAYYKSQLGVSRRRMIDPPGQVNWNNIGRLTERRAFTARNSRSTLVTVRDFTLTCP